MADGRTVLGIDIGTSGVKVLAVARDGSVPAEAFAPLPPPVADGDHREQDAELWWQAVVTAVRETLGRLHASGHDPSRVQALAVDGTSGTLVPVDAALRPLRPALMYHDGRSRAEAEHLNGIAGATLAKLGYRFNASFALAKILWLARHEPAVVDRTSCFLHQADIVTARLAGMPVRGGCLTDESNALKTGYDIVDRAWPAYLPAAGIDAGRLPRVVPTGTTLGTVTGGAAEATGLPAGCRIVGGMTDGTAAAAASGARAIGEGNTTLGTTIVWKLVASAPVQDPEGRLYCHRHPGGGYLPGGAGNAGGDGIRTIAAADARDPAARLAALAAALRPGPPTGCLTYPLPRPGERFPFVDAAFAPFVAETADPTLRYRSCLEGLACIERWGYEVAASLGAPCEGAVWTAGKGARFDAWMRLRADFLGRPVCRVARPESGFGAALVAAMNVWFDGSWDAAAGALLRQALRCEPVTAYRSACEAQYAAFREACDRQRRQHP